MPNSPLHCGRVVGLFRASPGLGTSRPVKQFDNARGLSMQVGVQSFASRVRPVFETKEAERVHSLQRLAATCRIFGRRG